MLSAPYHITGSAPPGRYPPVAGRGSVAPLPGRPGAATLSGHGYASTLEGRAVLPGELPGGTNGRTE